MDYLFWFYLIFFISMTSTGLAFLTSLMLKPEKKLKLIQLLLLISFLADAITAIAEHILDIYIYHVGATFRLFELVILLEFYRIIFPSKLNQYFSRIVQVIVPVGFLITLPFDTTPLRIINCILFCIYALFYFEKTLTEMKLTDPLKEPLFWVNSGVLLYFSSILFVMLFFKPLAKFYEASAVIVYMFHNIFLILKNIFFGIAFWKDRKLQASEKLD